MQAKNMYESLPEADVSLISRFVVFGTLRCDRMLEVRMVLPMTFRQPKQPTFDCHPKRIPPLSIINKNSLACVLRVAQANFGSGHGLGLI